MNVAELIEMLQDACEEAGVAPEDLEVRLAHQPSWALQYHTDKVAVVDLNEQEEDDDEEPEPTERKEPRFMAYIGEGSQVHDEPYLPSAAARGLGWRS